MTYLAYFCRYRYTPPVKPGDDVSASSDSVVKQLTAVVANFSQRFALCLRGFFRLKRHGREPRARGMPGIDAIRGPLTVTDQRHFEVE